MYSQSDLDQLLAAMRANGVTRLDLRRGGTHFRLDLPSAAAATDGPRSAPKPPARLDVKSPGIGHYLPRGDDDGLTSFEPGAAVTDGEILGYVCEGSARLVVAAPGRGVLHGDAPEPGAILGYGDILFTLEPAP